MTPSRTAWPPTGASRCACRRPSSATAVLALAPGGSGLGLAAGALGSAAPEALDATAGVHELLPARVERVAVRADLDVDLRLGRARRELVAARATDVRLDVLGMDVGLHRTYES